MSETTNITVDTFCTVPSSCVRGGWDVSVRVADGLWEATGEVTLVPRGYDGRPGSYGHGPDTWMEGSLLAALAARGLDTAENLTTIEAAARADVEASGVDPSPEDEADEADEAEGALPAPWEHEGPSGPDRVEWWTRPSEPVGITRMCAGRWRLALVQTGEGVGPVGFTAGDADLPWLGARVLILTGPRGD